MRDAKWRITAAPNPPYNYGKRHAGLSAVSGGGGSYFFTVNLLERKNDLLVRHVEVLRDAVRGVREARPFHIDAWVVLPDHMHCIWTLPEDDVDYSDRWKAIKIRFAKALPPTEYRSRVRRARAERAIWQRRFSAIAPALRRFCGAICSCAA